MKLPWSRSADAAQPVGGTDASREAEETQKCPGLSKILERILRDGRAEILDLGPFCAATAIFLADRGARVSVEEFEPPAAPPGPAPAAQRGKSLRPQPEEEAPPPIRLEQPDGKFDLVLVWEACDFVPPKRLAEFGRELNRVLAEGGFALLLASSEAPRQGHAAHRPPRYRVVAADRVAREPNEGPPLERYGHNPRDIERALAPLAVEGIQLQRNQLREFTLFKRAGTSR